MADVAAKPSTGQFLKRSEALRDWHRIYCDACRVLGDVPQPFLVWAARYADDYEPHVIAPQSPSQVVARG